MSSRLDALTFSVSFQGILHLGNAAVTEKDTVEGLKAHIADDDAKSSGGITEALFAGMCR